MDSSDDDDGSTSDSAEFFESRVTDSGGRRSSKTGSSSIDGGGGGARGVVDAASSPAMSADDAKSRVIDHETRRNNDNSSTSPSAARPTPPAFAPPHAPPTESDRSKIVYPQGVSTICPSSRTPTASERTSQVKGPDSVTTYDEVGSAAAAPSIAPSGNGRLAPSPHEYPNHKTPAGRLAASSASFSPESASETSTGGAMPPPRKPPTRRKSARPRIMEIPEEEDLLHKEVESLSIDSSLRENIHPLQREFPPPAANAIVDFCTPEGLNVEKLPFLPRAVALNAAAAATALKPPASAFVTSTPNFVAYDATISAAPFTDIVNHYDEFAAGGGVRHYDTGDVGVLGAKLHAFAKLQERQIKNVRRVQRKYFERLSQKLDTDFKKLEEARRDFNEECNEERAKIAQIRADLNEEKMRKLSKEGPKRVKELEEEVKKLSGHISQRNGLICELRLKLANAEKEKKTFKKDADDRAVALKEVREKLAKAYTDHSNTRVKLELIKSKKSDLEAKLKQERLHPSTSADAEASALNFSINAGSGGRTNASLLQRRDSATNLRSTISRNKSFDSASDLSRRSLRDNGVRRSVRWSSPLARSSSMTDLSGRTIFTFPGPSAANMIENMMNVKYEMTSRGNEYTFTNGPTTILCTQLKCHCLLYERNTGDFTWVYRMERQNVELNFYVQKNTFEICTPHRHRILFHADKQFEIHWRNGDQTLITPAGKRLEMFVLEERDEKGLPIRCFEMYESDGCVRWSTVDAPVEFQPELTMRNNHGEHCCSVSDLKDGSLAINAVDFRVRRVSENGFAKVGFNGLDLQMSVCSLDAAVTIKHVLSTGSDGAKEKRVCYEYGECEHRRC